MKTIFNINFKRIALSMAIMLTVGSLFVKANTRIEGRLVDVNNCPLPYATATIINPDTREIVEGDMSDENGKFYLENVKPGLYILSFRSVGYITDETRSILIPESDVTINTGKVYMNEVSVLLSEVIVHPGNSGNKNAVM